MKNLKCTVLALTMGASLFIGGKAFSQVPTYVPTNGLVGWWPFNANANDESGNGNNGTVNGATLTTDRFGVVNSAYYFNGNNDINIQGVNQNSDWTISFWFNSLNTSTFGVQYPLGIGCNSISTYGAPGFGINGGNQQAPCNALQLNKIFLNDGATECNSNLWTSNVYQQQSWYHVVINKSVNTYELFINSLNSASGTLSDIDIDNLILGKRCNFNWLKFLGNIDDLGLWNRALTECEIIDLYQAQLGSFSNSSVSINPTSSAIGSNATLSVSMPLQNLQWQSNPSNIGWVNVFDNANYSGATNDTLVVSNLQLTNHNQPFRVLACGDTSNIATIQIVDTCITNVTVYDTLYTTVTDTLIINTTLSLPAPNNENTILIYPNPASDHITIDNGNFAAMAGYTIKIENNAGQQVFQSAINQAQFYVDLSTWTGNGLYFVHLIDPQNNTVTVRKIVLQ
jgi:hypothetical protein